MPPGFQAAMLTSLEARFGYPIVTATDAIAWHLRALGARRIALASPYRGALAEAALAFWQAEGFEDELGRASGRERVCHYWYISVVRLYLKKKILAIP